MKKFLLLFVVMALLGVTSMASAGSNAETTTNQDIVSNTSRTISAMLNTRISAFAAPAPNFSKWQAKKDGTFNFAMNAEDLGLASGDAANNFGIWGMGSYTNFKSTESNGKYDADAFNFLVGADMRVTPELLLGVAAGWGNLDLDKKNWGDDNGSIKTDDALTIMPYMAYNILPELIFDAAFAYTNAEYKNSNSTDSGHYDSNTYMTNLGLSYFYNVDAWTLSSRLGYMYASGQLDSYSRGGVDVANPDTWIGQASLQGKAAYAFDCGAQPYASLTYIYDVQTSSTPVGSDYDEFEGALGLNWYTGGWTLNLEGATIMGRDKYESYRGTAFIRYEF